MQISLFAYSPILIIALCVCVCVCVCVCCELSETKQI